MTPPRKLSIALYSSSFLPKLGGQEFVIDALARELTRLGHTATVITPSPRSPLVASDNDFPYRVIRHPKLVSTRFGVAWYARYLHQAAKTAGGFDLIHCHDTYPAAYIATQANLAPLVITSHGGDLNAGNIRISKPGIEARCRQTLHHAAALIAISGFTRDNYLRVAGESILPKITDIPNGVYLSDLTTGPATPPPDLPLPQGAPYLLFLGRLHRRKGVDLLLEACPPEIPLLIVGEGDLRDSFAQASPNVHFLGRRTGAEKTYLLRHARAVVMPSRDWEAFPLVVLETAAAARPIIASDIPGLRDLVSADRTGLLFPEADVPALRAALTRLWTDPALADRLGATAHQQAQRYNWPQVAHEHLALYTRIATNH